MGAFVFNDSLELGVVLGNRELLVASLLKQMAAETNLSELRELQLSFKDVNCFVDWRGKCWLFEFLLVRDLIQRQNHVPSISLSRRVRMSLFVYHSYIMLRPDLVLHAPLKLRKRLPINFLGG